MKFRNHNNKKEPESPQTCGSISQWEGPCGGGQDSEKKAMELRSSGRERNSDSQEQDISLSNLMKCGWDFIHQPHREGLWNSTYTRKELRIPRKRACISKCHCKGMKLQIQKLEIKKMYLDNPSTRKRNLGCQEQGDRHKNRGLRAIESNPQQRDGTQRLENSKTEFKIPDEVSVPKFLQWRIELLKPDSKDRKPKSQA